ncbi:MAG: nickel-responsive transcriptional regulator NikR, partial [Victivallaceae bacterium]|nr:nickel-responsive transcriptional regulator NikR [Victivallaceae bacterium]
SIEKNLFKKLEKIVKQKGYENRSEFIRDIIRDMVVAEEWDSNDEIIATITLVFDHHKKELGEKLTDVQHKFHDTVLASTHVHLTHDICAEMIMVHGSARVVNELANKLRQQKGVLHAGLTMSSTAQKLNES